MGRLWRTALSNRINKFKWLDCVATLKEKEAFLKPTTGIKVPWWVWIGSVNAFLVFATIAYHFDLPLKKYLVSPFNLSMEMNLGVWWASMGLALAALLFLEHGIRGATGRRWTWVVLSLLVLGLSLDELGSIHERVGGWEILLPIMAVGGVVLISALAPVLAAPETRRTGLLVAAAFTLFGSVAVMEYLERAVDWPGWSLGFRDGLEEGVELGAVMLLIAAALRMREKSASGLGALIPDLGRLQKLPVLALTLLLAHSAACMVIPRIIDVSVKGNPLVWTPAVLLFTGTLFLAMDYARGGGLGKAGGAAFLALCSMSIVYNIGKILPSSLGIDAHAAFVVACILCAGAQTLAIHNMRSIVLLLATAGFLLLLGWTSGVDATGYGLSIGGLSAALTALFVPRMWLAQAENGKVSQGIAANPLGA
jgi:hypothetical protein